LERKIYAFGFGTRRSRQLIPSAMIPEILLSEGRMGGTVSFRRRLLCASAREKEDAPPRDAGDAAAEAPDDCEQNTSYVSK